MEAAHCEPVAELACPEVDFTQVIKVMETVKNGVTSTNQDAKSGSKRKRNSTKRKDSDIKKAKTAFVIYSQSVRSSVLQEDPTLSFSDVSRRIGALWKLLPPEEKSKFDSIAACDKDRYLAQTQLKAIKDASTSNTVNDGDGISLPDTNASIVVPHRKRGTASALTLYGRAVKAEFLSNHPGLQMAEIKKLMTSSWKTLPISQRQPFIDNAKLLSEEAIKSTLCGVKKRNKKSVSPLPMSTEVCV